MNWANASLGAVIVGASSDLSGCEAANVLDDDLTKVWLSDHNLPQWICISLHGLENLEDVFIRTIGWHCWHAYSTNPKEVKLHVSRDGTKFRVWDTLIASSNARGNQLFCCEPINASLYPYIALEILSTFGGQQTYLNQVYFLSDEVTNSLSTDSDASNILSDDSLSLSVDQTNKKKEKQANKVTSSTSTLKDEAQSIMNKLHDSLGIEGSKDQLTDTADLNSNRNSLSDLPPLIPKSASYDPFSFVSHTKEKELNHLLGLDSVEINHEYHFPSWLTTSLSFNQEKKLETPSIPLNQPNSTPVPSNTFVSNPTPPSNSFNPTQLQVKSPVEEIDKRLVDLQQQVSQLSMVILQQNNTHLLLLQQQNQQNQQNAFQNQISPFQVSTSHISTDPSSNMKSTPVQTNELSFEHDHHNSNDNIPAPETLFTPNPKDNSKEPKKEKSKEIPFTTQELDSSSVNTSKQDLVDNHPPSSSSSASIQEYLTQNKQVEVLLQQLLTEVRTKLPNTPSQLESSTSSNNQEKIKPEPSNIDDTLYQKQTTNYQIDEIHSSPSITRPKLSSRPSLSASPPRDIPSYRKSNRYQEYPIIDEDLTPYYSHHLAQIIQKESREAENPPYVTIPKPRPLSPDHYHAYQPSHEYRQSSFANEKEYLYQYEVKKKLSEEMMTPLIQTSIGVNNQTKKELTNKEDLNLDISTLVQELHQAIFQKTVKEAQLQLLIKQKGSLEEDNQPSHQPTTRSSNRTSSNISSNRFSNRSSSSKVDHYWSMNKTFK